MINICYGLSINTSEKGETIMLDFRMETFLTVCNDMNFTHAAEHLNLTQPAVSQHIKHLEKTYGTELFIRDKKKLRLTPAGEILRSALETMRNDENTLKKRMQESIEEKKSSDLWRNNDHWRICDRTCSFPFCQNTSGHGFSHPIWQHPDSAHLSL